MGLVVYNLWAKDVPVVGNLLISLLGAAAFLYGAATAGSLWPAGIAAGFAGLYHFGREILKDVADQAGDRRVRGDNVPLRWGLRPALIGATVLYSLLVVATPVPYLIGIYSWPYLALVLLLDALLLGLLFQLWSDPDPGRFARVSRLLKVGMPLGLAAILLGAL